MRNLFFILIFFFSQSLSAQHRILVCQQPGSQGFRTIQDAINSIPDSSKQPTEIYIMSGTYNERLMIEKSNLLITGELRDKVIITSSIARDSFRCSHPDDWGVATINLKGNDIYLQNLTVKNTFGFDLTTERTIPCENDTATHQKKLTRTGHQMAVRLMKGTRFSAVNCTFSSFGGDTMSPWNVENGVFHFDNCRFEGGVDLFCPRGFSFAENCEFYAYNGPAIIWHDGSKNPESISVLKNCRFNGYDGFSLGRYHRDAKMLLVDCVFAANMKDLPIYHVTKSTEIKWGQRIYYKNCHKKGGDFSWFADNAPQELIDKYGNANYFKIATGWMPDKNLIDE
jgi:pectinesterase